MRTDLPELQASSVVATVAGDQTGSGPHPIKRGVDNGLVADGMVRTGAKAHTCSTVAHSARKETIEETCNFMVRLC